MQGQRKKLINAEEVIRMLTDILGDDPRSKSRIRADYEMFKSRVDDNDARTFAAVKYLKDLIVNNRSKERE